MMEDVLGTEQQSCEQHRQGRARGVRSWCWYSETMSCAPLVPHYLSRFLSVKHNVCISVLKWLSSRVEIFDICLKVYRPWVQFSNGHWKGCRLNRFVSNAKLIFAVCTYTIGYICHNWVVTVDVIIILIKRILLLVTSLTRWTMLGLLPLVLAIFSPLYARLPVYQQWVSSGEAVNNKQETWDYNKNCYVFSLYNVHTFFVGS